MAAGTVTVTPAAGRSAVTASSAATCAMSCWSAWPNARHTAMSSSPPWRSAFTASTRPAPASSIRRCMIGGYGLRGGGRADGRKVYTITEQGRSFLAAGGARIAEIGERLRGWLGPFERKEYRAEIAGIQQDLDALAQALRIAGSRANPERLRRIHAVTWRAWQEVAQILQEQEPEPRPAADEQDAERQAA